MVAGPGSAAFIRLSGNLSHAGLFIALTYLGGATGAMLGGRAMDRYGRKRPLIFAYCMHAAGFTLAGFGASGGSLPVFVLGTATFAAAFGIINLTRLTAAEMFVPAERGKGVAWIQVSAIFGAVIGPLLLVLSEPIGRILGRAPLDFVWFLAPPLLLTSALIVRGIMEPREIAARVAGSLQANAAAQPTVAPEQAVRLIIIGGMALAASQAGMAAVMGVAGAAVSHAGHDVSVLGGLMFMHFIGMFGLSLIVGRLADRIGRRVTISVGLSLLAAGGAAVALVASPVGLGIGLLLVGFGWSFGFIGATVLITDVTAPSHRARTLGRVDLVSQSTSALIAVGGGWWFAMHGMAGLGILAVAVAALPLTLLMLVREDQPGRYARVAGAVT
jgi:MFS family permease